MTTPIDARTLMINAVRSDLFGQTEPGTDLWPGSRARTFNLSQRETPNFETNRDVKGPFADEEGNEILPMSPLRRYGIGVLVPNSMARSVEDELTAIQDDDPDLLPPDGPVPEIEAEPAPGHAEVDDAIRDDTPERPRSMAISFLLKGQRRNFTVEVRGGRYEPVVALVGGEERTFWVRRAVESEISTADFVDEHHLAIGALALKIGVLRRHHRDGEIVTVFLLNESAAGSSLDAATCASFFQAQLRVRIPDTDLLDYPSAAPDDDPGLNLLYHRHQVRVVGHGCDASATTVDGGWLLSGTHFPVFELSLPTPARENEHGDSLEVDMEGLAQWDPTALDGIERIIDSYREWIEIRSSEVLHLEEPLVEAAHHHLEQCRKFLSDIQEGWQLAQANLEVQETLRWTSEAMANQRRAYAASTRQLILSGGSVSRVDGLDPHEIRTKPPTWRAFQIAFLLASLPPAIHRDHPLRSSVDIIWFATGAGKTEAYSAVAAFTILWRRRLLNSGDQKFEGSTVLMRYTLRLLTAQQLQRAASLICALELIRQREPLLREGKRFTIGAWLGSASTPNNRESARIALKKWSGKERIRGFLLTRCPWCATTIGRRDGDGNQAIDGYRMRNVEKGSTVMAYCPNPQCAFNPNVQEREGRESVGLPVFEIDEDIYLARPTFVVGTIDKFALLAWRSEPSRLFGIANGIRKGPGPELLIQDELHLISGPLGSLDALYEPVIRDLCVREGGVPPRIIAATATAKRYDEQVASLYGGAPARLIPPPGLDVDDNFFARRTSDIPPKTFVGIHAPNFGANQEAQMRLVAALSHAAGSLDAIGANADPWWTNLCFFSSRRSLGLVQSLSQTHLRSHTWGLHTRTGVDAGPQRTSSSGRQAQRPMSTQLELTAQATDDVTQTMNRLGVTLDSGKAVDICFATSMIEVGVDIDRLGLMTMFGQPKSASQYIQVAGRVGRDLFEAPGLVFVLLSPYNPRDRSHFEQFSSFHERLYASVEPVSITPHTPAALHRGLSGALTSWLRQSKAIGEPKDAIPSFDDGLSIFLEAASTKEERENIHREARELRDQLQATTLTEWGNLNPSQAPTGFLRPQGDERDGDEVCVWRIPTSMRSVEPESGARTIDRIGNVGAQPRSTGNSRDLDGEDLT